MSADSWDVPIEGVIPHAAPMSLLDRVEDYGQGHLRATIQVHADKPFCQQQGMPGSVGIELMAQAIAAYAGIQARQEGEAIRIGFLVGTRRYSCSHPVFPLNATLAVEVREALRGANSLSVFQCTIAGLGEHADIRADAKLNVFHPENPNAFLRGEAHV